MLLKISQVNIAGSGGAPSGLCSWYEIASGTSKGGAGGKASKGKGKKGKNSESSSGSADDEDAQPEQSAGPTKTSSIPATYGDDPSFFHRNFLRNFSSIDTHHLLYPPFPAIRVLLTSTGKLVTIDNRRLYALQRIALEHWPKRTLVQVLVSPIKAMPKKRMQKEGVSEGPREIVVRFHQIQSTFIVEACTSSSRSRTSFVSHSAVLMEEVLLEIHLAETFGK